MLTTYIATIISLTINSQGTWFNDRFYGVGFIHEVRGDATITDVSGFETQASWTSLERPGPLIKKTVELVKGQSPQEDPNQPSWQTEVNPLGYSGLISVPYPDPNPFTLPANKRAVWIYKKFVDYYESDWSRRYSLESTLKLNRHRRDSQEIQVVTSEMRFEPGYGQD